jgi:phosphatidylinositol alpha-1,6-mannosyltransferase
MTRGIRILALITDGFGGQGGISQYNRDLLTAWSGADSVGEIVAVPRVGRAEQAALPARVRQSAPVFNRVGYASYSIGVAATKGPFDLVFCGHIAHSALAAAIAGRLKVPLWLQLHGIDAWTCPRPLIRWGVERSALVTVVSRYTKRRFLNWANIRPELVRVLPNTVSDRFSPGPKSEAILEQYGLQGKRIMLTLSRISTHDRYKGHHRVLTVMPDLLREFPDLVYVVAGDGNGRQQLERLATELGVAAHVSFIGRIDDAQLPDLYRTADVFVMPSTEEGFGIVFLEAMRSGIPAIGGNEDGSTDPLRDGTAGYTVSCDNRGELLDAIRSALDRPRTGIRHADLFSFPAFSKHCAGLLSHCLAQVDR